MSTNRECEGGRSKLGEARAGVQRLWIESERGAKQPSGNPQAYVGTERAERVRTTSGSGRDARVHMTVSR